MIFLKNETEDKKEIFCIGISNQKKFYLVYYYSFLLNGNEWIEYKTSGSSGGRVGDFRNIDLSIKDLDRDKLLDDLCEVFKFDFELSKETKKLLINKFIEAVA